MIADHEALAEVGIQRLCRIYHLRQTLILEPEE